MMIYILFPVCVQFGIWVVWFFPALFLGGWNLGNGLVFNVGRWWKKNFSLQLLVPWISMAEKMINVGHGWTNILVTRRIIWRKPLKLGMSHSDSQVLIGWMSGGGWAASFFLFSSLSGFGGLIFQVLGWLDSSRMMEIPYFSKQVFQSFMSQVFCNLFFQKKSLTYIFHTATPVFSHT